jgi:hypothetical protein
MNIPSAQATDIEGERMSKYFFVACLALITLAAFDSKDAFADRARLLVFGTGDGGLILGGNGNMGSFYTDDAYNIFYNPAYINDYKNFGVIEKSNYNQAYTLGATGTLTTTSGGTTAEGGFVTSIFNYNLAVFMNRTDVLSDAIYSNPSSMRPIDIMLGGDNMGCKWGLGVTYSSYRGTPVGSTTMATDNDVVVRLGLEHGGFEPFGWYRFGGDNHFVLNSSDEQNKMWAVGAKYHWGEWTPYAAFKKTSFNGLDTGTIFGGGLGRNTTIIDGVKLSYSLAFFRQAASDNFGFSSSDNTELNPQRSVLPINVAVEGDAASWVTLRAGLSYNLVDQEATGSAPDSTSARIGASIHANKVDFDWAVGKSANFAQESSTDADSQNFDIANGFFTAAAVQYKW